MTLSGDAIFKNVQEYYGSIIQSRADLCTTACHVDELSTSNKLIRDALARVHPQILERYYGCGSPIPPAVKDIVVLDLGCGTGRDCYVLSQLVGPQGCIIGVDVSKEQIAVAKSFAEWHAEKFGYANIEFRHGQMEDLATAGVEDDSVDLVVSNCALNLSPNKESVAREIFRVLKSGGELHFSDVFTNRRIPRELMLDPVLHGECLAGAWYFEDLRRLMASTGCVDMRIISSRPITIHNPEVQEKIGFANFTSCTVQAFKLPSLEDRCEDYGQIAIYRGTVSGHPHTFQLDDRHDFPRGKGVHVCGNTADMLTATRFTPHFELLGDKSVHYGPFASEGPLLRSPTGVFEGSITKRCC